MNRSFFILIIAFFASSILLSQPSNDDCSGVVNLGNLPLCSDMDAFTNEGATASNISTLNNAPNCFNGGQVDRDVWFSFFLPADVTDITIIINGNSGNTDGISNPQIALYRGLCEFDRLNLLGCSSAILNDNSVRLDMFGLIPGFTYFIRVNDYSENTIPNSGNFQICVEEYVAVFNMGDGINSSGSCSGTLYDSGGPNSEYMNGENYTFEICPTEFNQCINLEFKYLALEKGADRVVIYEGSISDNKIISETSTIDLLNSYSIKSASDCVTILFSSDGTMTNGGFELTWECEATECEGTSIDSPDEITSFPHSSTHSVCEDFSSIGGNICSAFEGSEFLGGPDYVYELSPNNDVCLSFNLTSSEEGTGLAIVYIKDGTLDCLTMSPSGYIDAIGLDAGTIYYVIIANQSGCFSFDLSINPTDLCSLDPSLKNALCNPLNTCLSSESAELRRRFVFSQEIFADINIISGINSGCWNQDIILPTQVDNTNFYWFSLRAYSDGNIGFYVESVVPSDIDFNVWGPFTDEDVCSSPDSVIRFIENNQPIRSSWVGNNIPTGLADIHPVTGVPVFDEFDCDFPEPGDSGDGIVRTIEALEGETYIFLFNDYGGSVNEEGIIVDWSSMDQNTILSDEEGLMMSLDTVLCPGEVLDLSYLNPPYPLRIVPNDGVSCQNCLDPVITPLSNYSEYKVLMGGSCILDTLLLSITVLEDFEEQNYNLCNNDILTLDISVPNQGVEYLWSGDIAMLSCIDCSQPIFQTNIAGNYSFTYVIIIDGCSVSSSVNIVVDTEIGAEYIILPDTTICEGDNVNLGGSVFTGTIYSWTINGVEFSTIANPDVSPDSTTTYYLSASNNLCSFEYLDSVTVTINIVPDQGLISDRLVCEGDTIILNTSLISADFDYAWTSDHGNYVLDSTDGKGVLVAIQSGAYTLVTSRGDCSVTQEVNIEVTPSRIDLLPNVDTLKVCLNDSFELSFNQIPLSSTPILVRTDGGDTILRTGTLAVAKQSFFVYAEIENATCLDTDTLFVQVDSLPEDLSIMPVDTTICEGSVIILTSPIFNTVRYRMNYKWMPTAYFKTGDSLYNAVVEPTDTISYIRVTTSGACIDTAHVTVNVNKIPVISITASKDTICPGELVDLLATVTPMDSELKWTSGSARNCDDCFDPEVRPTSTDRYTLEADNQGCPGMGSITITVIDDSPDFTIPLDRIICEGELVALNQEENLNYQYRWTSSDPNFTDQNTRNPIISPPIGNTSYIVIVSDTISACSDSRFQFNIFVPKLNELNDIAFCNPNKEYTLLAEMIGFEDYTFTNDDIISWSTGESTPSITVNSLDSPVSLTVSIDGCTSTSSMAFRPLDLIVGLTNSIDSGSVILATTITKHDLNIMVDDSDQIESITWSNLESGDLLQEGGESYSHTHEGSGLYTIQVFIRTEAGCEQLLIVTYTIVPFGLPNAFSPNGDNVNDNFNVIIDNIEVSSIEISEFKIYTRWGSLIYDNETPIQGWDGTDGSKPLPPDAYKYIIKLSLEGISIETQGEINLIR